MSGRMVLSEKEETAAAEFMAKAELLARELLTSSKLFIWRGKHAYRDTNIMFDTLIVSQTKHEEGKKRTKTKHLLLVQRDAMGADIECIIGSEHCGSSVPFGSGHSPIKQVDNWLKKLAQLDLSMLGNSFVWELERKLSGLNIFLSVQTYIWGTNTNPLYRCDVVKGLNPEDDLCVAFVINQSGNVVVLTPAHLKGVGKLNEVSRHQFDEKGGNPWIDDALLTDAVLDELTS